MKPNGTRGTLLVIGGGITGITAAIEAAEAGCSVTLVEKRTFLGGRVARTHRYFPKLCPPQCGLEINLRRVKTHPRIRCLTLAEVVEIRGVPGDFHATIRINPRGVTERCTACGACVDACPVERADEFNLGLASTKAIYLPYDMAFPTRFAIDPDVCQGPECAKCVPACPFDAIHLGGEPETTEVDAQAVIWATGWKPFEAGRIAELGYAAFPNVITNVMLERYASHNGPTGGRILRPSDQEPIRSVAFVQCAGSRDENYLPYCSGVCCAASLKQTRYIREQYPDAEIFVFYIDIRAPGRLEDFYVASQADERLTLIRGKVAKVTEDASSHRLTVESEDTISGQRITQEVDLVVLATGMVPEDTNTTTVDGGMRFDDYGFLAPEQSQEGFLVAGCAKRPVDVATCVRDATGAAMRALRFCTEARRG